jgi:WS/DGAT/MGAT family acyltransferase
MSATEAIMWAVEKDAALRSDFCNITILDRPPDLDRLKERMLHAVATMPHLGERVVTPPLRLAPPEWRTDLAFDIDYHVRSVALPDPATVRDLLDLAAQLCATPFDRSRPLWEFTVIEGLAGGHAALLQKVHHTITDGVGGLRLSLSIVDRRAEEPPVADVQRIVGEVDARDRDERRDDPVRRNSAITVARDALAYRVHRNAEMARTAIGAGVSLALHPGDAPRAIGSGLDLLGSLRRQVLVTDAAHSPLLAPRSLGRRFDLFTFPLESATSTAHALGGRVNDVFVCGVAGALGRYLARMGQPVHELRMAMPISTRTAADTAANRFVPTRTLVPTTPKDPAERFVITREALRHLRGERAVTAAESLADLIVNLPTSMLVAATRSQTRTIDFATSNLRGSPVDLFVAGARITENFPIGPRGGSAVNFTTLSYCGVMHVGINSDPAAITDPDALLECLDESFADLLAIGEAATT